MQQVEPQEVKPDGLSLLVFLKCLELIGGPRRLFELRNLTWVPSLMEAAYAVVLREHFNRTEDEIAQFLGLTRPSVRNILRADPEAVRERLEGALEERRRTAHVHIAGGLAKLAYRAIKTEGATLGLLDEVAAALAAFQQIKT